MGSCSFFHSLLLILFIAISILAMHSVPGAAATKMRTVLRATLPSPPPPPPLNIAPVQSISPLAQGI
ncbi:hypothetical protein Patl1_19217 [Pistacia atlantica]|uniref:Uncharacterized protein n=1 Tax=Pistacia atlantica TaxID=434234 RepID=A0ACC1BYL8_9ROSI|nr:hypothetical protein Patl1_19217 [Pistacia atlantica]